MAITRDSLLSLEAYAKARNEFRARVLAHKKARTVHLGDHVTLIFEDELTVRYQIQEMLRIEKVFEEAGIQDELDVYNPLVPDGSNFKATMLIEYEDPGAERGAGAAGRHRGPRMGRGRRMLRGSCDRRRGPAARERVEDLRRAFPALRARHRRWHPRCEAARGLGIGVDHPQYEAVISAVARRRARRSLPISRKGIFAGRSAGASPVS